MFIEEVSRSSRDYYDYYFSIPKYHLTLYTIVMLIMSYAATGGFWISNVLAIKEPIKTIRALKITAVICVAYLWIFGTIMTPMEPDFRDIEKLVQLAGLASLAFVITALAAWIISRTSNNTASGSKVETDEESNQFVSKTEAELRAEIEEKVRREMLEKDVREKLEAEQFGDNKTDNQEMTGIESEQKSNMIVEQFGGDDTHDINNE